MSPLNNGSYDISSSLIHADETGINISGARKWLHNASNAKGTFFHHCKRGGEAMDDSYKKMLGSDNIVNNNRFFAEALTYLLALSKFDLSIVWKLCRHDDIFIYQQIDEVF